MRCHAVAAAGLALSLSLPGSAEPSAHVAPTLTAATHMTGAPLRSPGAPVNQAIPRAANEDPADPPTTKPWLLALTGIVLAAVMARRRL